MAILSVALLGGIIYLAVSHRSSRMIRLTALIALGLIGLSIGFCAFLIIRGPGHDPAAINLPVFQDTPTVPAKKNNIPTILVFLAVFLLILGSIVFVALRGQRNIPETPKKPDDSSVYLDRDDLDMELENKPDEFGNDDSFDIEIE